MRGGIPAKLFLGTAALLILALGGAGFWIVRSAQARFDVRQRDVAQRTATALLAALPASGAAPADLNAALRAGLAPDDEFVLHLRDGTVVARLNGPTRPADILAADEVAAARADGAASVIRPVVYRGRSRLCAAARGPETTPYDVLWVASPRWRIADSGGFLLELLVFHGALVLLVTLGVALGVRRLWTRPMQRITEMADSLAEGDLSARADIAGDDGVGALARSLNALCTRWAADMRTIDRQRATLASLLQQLHEGVIVARPDGRIALINPAAVELLNLNAAADAGGAAALVGAVVERCVPQHEVQRLLHCEPAAPADVAKVQEANIAIDGPGGARQVLARASGMVLPDAGRGGTPAAAGRLLVLTDITELARTLQIKTDFVANASHELRTPLSTIRAAVETLLTMSLPEEAEAAQRFLRIIERHVGRLSALVSDLLDLARVESPQSRFEAQALDPAEITQELEKHFEDVIRARGLRWERQVTVPAGVCIRANRQLLRLVLDNLVDNAVKFTEAGRAVRLTCALRPEGVAFVVADEGCGIPEAEQERVFERFYQVERARSGPERGTGLGLSIVRHAVAALGGAVSLRSRPGIGTCVEVVLPTDAGTQPLPA